MSKATERAKLLAAAVTAEEGKQIEWRRTRETPKGFFKGKGRQGKYLHISSRPGLLRTRTGGAYHPRPKVAVEKFTAQQRRTSTRAKRARVAREGMNVDA